MVAISDICKQASKVLYFYEPSGDTKGTWASCRKSERIVKFNIMSTSNTEKAKASAEKDLNSPPTVMELLYFGGLPSK